MVPDKTLRERLEEIDPFDVTPKMIADNEEEFRLFLLDRVSEEYRLIIRDIFHKTGAASLIMCDRGVVFASTDRYAALEEAKSIEKEIDKICYIFTEEKMPIEEYSASR